MRLFLFSLFLVSGLFFYAQQSTNCQDLVTVRVINKQDNIPIPNAGFTLTDENNNKSYYEADASGNFEFQLPCDNSRYVLSCAVENYTQDNKLVFTSKEHATTHQITLNLFPIKEFVDYNGRKRVIMESIDFIPNDYHYNDDSKPVLRKLYRILKKYPYLKIEIGVHSDSRGTQDFITQLTQKRADACADFLISKGISSDRVVAKGYGFSQLLNECKKGVKCTDDQHLKNRRTEILVIE